MNKWSTTQTPQGNRRHGISPPPTPPTTAHGMQSASWQQRCNSAPGRFDDPYDPEPRRFRCSRPWSECGEQAARRSTPRPPTRGAAVALHPLLLFRLLPFSPPLAARCVAYHRIRGAEHGSRASSSELVASRRFESSRPLQAEQAAFKSLRRQAASGGIAPVTCEPDRILCHVRRVRVDGVPVPTEEEGQDSLEILCRTSAW